MPRRKKSKSTAKPKGYKSGISINIKNIMKQVQNARPPRNQDFIKLTGKKPMDNLDSGNMTRLQVPAMTYASRPLSQFPSLASLSNIVQEFAPPLSQISGPAPQPIRRVEEPLPAQAQLSRPSRVAVKPNPIIPEYNPSRGLIRDPNINEMAIPPEQYLLPALSRSELMNFYNEGKEDQVRNDSQYLVSNQVPLDFIERRRREAAEQRENKQMQKELQKIRRRTPAPAPVAAAGTSPPRSATVRPIRREVVEDD